MNFNFIIKSGGYEVKITKMGIIFNIIRIVLGGIFILGGFGGLMASSFVAGLFAILTGISLLPIIYKKINFNKFKYASIVLPVLFFVLLVLFVPPGNSKNEVQKPEESTLVEESSPPEKEKIEIESLHFDDSELEMDIKETKEIVLKILPNNAEIEGLECCTSDEKIASLEKTNVKDDKSEITFKVKPTGEGSCEIFSKAKNGVESNKITLKIIDKDRIEAEEKAKKEAEEQAKKEAENKAKQQASQSSASQSSAGSSSSSGAKQKSSANNSHGKAIYCTPHGKRYHYDPDCGGKNSKQTTWEYAKSIGLTPCQKCVH